MINNFDYRNKKDFITYWIDEKDICPEVQSLEQFVDIIEKII